MGPTVAPGGRVSRLSEAVQVVFGAVTERETTSAEEPRPLPAAGGALHGGVLARLKAGAPGGRGREPGTEDLQRVDRPAAGAFLTMAALRPFFSGCTQAGSNGRLLRNYDFPPDECEATIVRSHFLRPVIGMHEVG
jgi:hypothetical protein